MGCSSTKVDSKSATTAGPQPVIFEATSEEKALARLNILFASIDNDAEGKVDKEELTAALTKDLNLGSLIKDAGMNPKYYILDQLDTNKDGRVSWDEFFANLKERAVEEVKTTGVVAAAALLVEEKALVEEVKTTGVVAAAELPEEKALKHLKEVFDSIDVDGKGGVSKKELASALEQDDGLRELISQASLNPKYATVAQLDTNKDGSVTWDEFVQFLKKVAQDIVVDDAIEEREEKGCITVTCGF